jgi:hypothetical protein
MMFAKHQAKSQDIVLIKDKNIESKQEETAAERRKKHTGRKASMQSNRSHLSNFTSNVMNHQQATARGVA